MNRRIFISSVAALLASPAIAADNAAAVGVIQAEVEQIVATFMTSAGDLVKGFTTPKVVVSFTPELSWIKPDGSEVHTVAWVQCPPDFQSFIASLLGDTPIMAPDVFFGDVFNTFLVPHEMSHFVDAKRDNLRNGGRFYDGEVHANRVAVAFWLSQTGGKARMERLMSAVEVVESHLPSPVPEGQDRIAYFQENYTKLGSDPAAYGWYQFRMFLDAWALRDEKDFKTLLEQGA
ncbi:hypothetical protein [Asticcacaulis benevestitus]|uniref:Metalloprotease n=1 Tax=Asticcacaulis benevestitus DSM 16100 = ATCC BAA-896 TaxID=1121022 RepID=V4P972_9CAUL|nr:hypothetical protein [Asticcacaulis benevestitus]ESQ90477.1 hypothetical protein ABENE_12200 [Asticcacaulis benevestitus DSM 16100 = ATCC BAA-896]